MTLRPVEFDWQSAEPGLPHVITADCSSPREIDDGVFVEQLDADTQAYRVGVCIADGRKLYRRQEVLQVALGLTRASYYDLGDNEQGYEPMIPPHYIYGKELREGNVRNALIVSFVAERGRPLSDVAIEFGNIEVVKNYDYKEFSQRAETELALGKYAAAATLIGQGLGYTPGGDKTTPPRSSAAQDARANHWKHGSRMVEAFMIATNTLVGNTFAEEGRPAIYRVHDTADTTHDELIGPNVAVYSENPGEHLGLGLRNFSRVTSPLRRVEDLVMHHHIGLRAEGIMPSTHDMRIMRLAIRALNQRTIADQSLRAVAGARESARRLSVVPELDLGEEATA